MPAPVSDRPETLDHELPPCWSQTAGCIRKEPALTKPVQPGLRAANWPPPGWPGGGPRLESELSNGVANAAKSVPLRFHIGRPDDLRRCQVCENAFKFQVRGALNLL